MLRFSQLTRSVHGTLAKVNNYFGLRCFCIGEQWKEAPGFPNYAVSSVGRVKNIITNKLLVIDTNHYRRPRISLYKNGRRKHFPLN